MDFLPGTASLVEEVDSMLVSCINNLYCLERLLVVLRDGRKIFGTLRSFDQFGK